MMFEILHWGSLGAAQLISWRLFRDLADISQWIVKVERSQIFKTFRIRHWLAGAVALFWGIALISHLTVGSGEGWALAVISAIVALAMFMGYINPRIMMRTQVRTARYYSIEEAQNELDEQTSLIVIEANGVARGHPDRHILRPHVAGTPEGLGGENVVLTYCGLTNLGIAYTPEIDGQPLDLAPMTQIQNNLVMWDRISGKPVQQVWGRREGIDPHSSAMKEWPSFRMPLWAFRRAFPDGTVFLNPVPKWSRNPAAAIYDRLVQLMFVKGIEDQANKDEPTFPTVTRVDDRLPSKAKVYGAIVGSSVAAFTQEYIESQGDIINAVIGGRRVVVAYHRDLDSIGMYWNPTPHLIDWVEFGGACDHGVLKRVETMRAAAYWIVWQQFYPETAINPPPISSGEGGCRRSRNPDHDLSDRV